MLIGSSFLVVLAWLLAIPVIVLLIETVAAIFLPQRRMDFASGNAGATARRSHCSGAQ